MTPTMGAPGDGIGRREFLAATGSAGAVAMAGCTAMSDPTVTEVGSTGGGAARQSDLPTTDPPEVVDLDERGHEVTLQTVTAAHDVHPLENMGGPVRLPQVWAFQADDGPASVPGPILRATEGAELEVTLKNTMSMPHTVHFHGSQTAWEDDGVPTTTGITVDPGEEYTYTIPANTPGTHLYHCHYQTPWHMEMGMYGVLRIDPEGYEPADREYFMTVRDWDSRLSRQYAGGDATYDITNRRPDVFTVNGKSAPRTLHPEDGSPMIVEQGDTVRIHWVNAGFNAHPLHTHNHRFTVVEKDGGTVPEAARYERDTLNVAPADRYTVEFEADADPGIYLMHCHKVDHVRNGGTYPGGMLGGIVYQSVMDTDIFAKLMEYAGYEG